MYLIDTHSHIYQPDFDEDSNMMIQRAFDAGIKKIFLPNIDMESIGRMHKLCDTFPNVCYPMMGLHPCDVKENFREVLDQMYCYFSTRKHIAVGETGIDLYWDKTTLPLQIEAFKIQVEWAKDFEIPIVIHARDSFDEIFSVLEEVNDERLTGVFHCFTGSLVQANQVISLGGFMMGIGGVLTYDKSGLDKVVADIPMKYLILETDSPYLTPKPYRGKRNESAYTRIVAEKLAMVKDVSLETVMRETTTNALKLFNSAK